MPYKSEFPPAPVADRPFSERMLEALWQNHITNPDRPVLVSAEDDSIRVTNKELYIHSLAIAAFLEKRHFGHGDISCVVLPNCWEYLAIFMGATLQGGAISGASILFTDYELERQFNDAECKVIFCSDTSLERVLKAARRCPLTVVVVPSPKAPKRDYPFGVHTFEQVLHTQPNIHRPLIKHDVNKDLLILPFSSGTTGSPKGVMLSHRNFSTMMNIVIQHFGLQIEKKLDPNWDWGTKSMLLFLPFYHIYGFGVMSQTILLNAQGVIMTHFDPDVFCRNIQKYKIKMLFLVPPILVFLAKHPIVDKYDLSSIEFINTGAAPAGKDLIEEVKRRLPNIQYIVQGYGMTECGMASHLPILNQDKYSAAGKLASNYEMKIIDTETQQEVPQGKSGEICVRGPTIMMGYFKRPEATAETIDSEGWLHTGDIGYLSEDGWVYVVDRLKELIKVKGLQVPPAELEDLLLSNQDIHDCAVIGIPDESSGEVPKAYVVKRNPKLTEKQVMDFVKERVAHYKQLKGGVEFIQEIPKSAAGKILRRFLRDQNKQGQGQSQINAKL